MRCAYFATGKAEEHLLLHLLPVHQCRQSPLHANHAHPERCECMSWTLTMLGVSDIRC